MSTESKKDNTRYTFFQLANGKVEVSPKPRTPIQTVEAGRQFMEYATGTKVRRELHAGDRGPIMVQLIH